MNWTLIIVKLKLGFLTKFSITLKRIEASGINENELLDSLNEDKNYSRKYVLLKGKTSTTLIEEYNIFALYSNDLEILERLNKYPYTPFYYLFLEKKKRKIGISYKLGQGTLLTIGLLLYFIIKRIAEHGLQLRIKLSLLFVLIIIAVITLCESAFKKQERRIDEAIKRVKKRKLESKCN